eukprot:g22467.t1
MNIVDGEFTDGHVDILGYVDRRKQLLGLVKNIKIDLSPGADEIYLRMLREEVAEIIDEGRMIDVVYMDFSKVFDLDPHGRLIKM